MTLREAALRHAVTFIGTKEQPPYSNRGPMIDKWNKDACGTVGVFWCASFVHGMYLLAGRKLPGGASVGQIRAWAASCGTIVARPRRGDLVCFEWQADNGFDDHIGIVERVLALRWSGDTFTGWVQTIEGNTSAQADTTGSQSNGGGVYRRRRWIRGIRAQYVRVPGDQT